MEQERRSIRAGLAVIACAIVFRLISAGVLEQTLALLRHPAVASFQVYMETGRIVGIPPEPTDSPVPETTDPPPTPPPPQQEEKPRFQAQDAQLVDISRLCGYAVDVEQLLLSPLTWDLTQGGPAVLILHTHATESYTQVSGDTYAESSAYRTLDTQHNMVRIGDEIAELLESHGIEVLHDTTLHDYPSYSGSYSAARNTIADYLKQYPSIRMVLDIHRDAAELDGEVQLTTNATVGGHASSQLMMVVGTDAGGLYHPGWQENMALALKLHVQLEKNDPGICRPVSFRTERFNQDMLPGALLIEIGAAGDTLQQALTAAQALAQGIIDLAAGTATADSTN